MVLAFNHQNYITEHLESIKYLVEVHGRNWEVDLIISDDCSSDNTLRLIRSWTDKNKKLFSKVEIIANKTNQGTCACVINMLEFITVQKCKLTAGDDIYSFENIFKLSDIDKSVGIMSGRVLYLTDNRLYNSKFSTILESATDIIYRNSSMYKRFVNFSLNNAPNIIYKTTCLTHPETLEYLEKFDVVEDWPLQIAISRNFPEKGFKLINECLVYYRRTQGSTYLVANTRFKSDKLQVYQDLCGSENNLIAKARLLNRKYLFGSHWLANIFLNVNSYIFLFSIIANISRILSRNNFRQRPLSDHQNHYNEIRKNASTFVKKNRT